MGPFKNLAMLSLVLLALLLGLANAQPAPTTGCGLVSGPIATQITNNESWYCPINQQVYSQWSSSLPWAMIVIMISFCIAAIIFMTGVVLNSNKIRNFGIGEFYEAIATTIIVAAFLYVCAVIFGLLPGVLVGNINPYATAFNLIGKTISTAQQMYTALFNVYLSLSFTTTPQISLAVGGETIGLQSFINIYSVPVTIFFLDPAVAIARFLAEGITALYAEYYLMLFFSVAAIPAFLIPGVFFRSIFPTRAFGGILIALAFGFYLIMPALFSVAYYFTAPAVQRDMAVATLQVTKLSYTDQNALSATSPLVQQLFNVKSSLNGFWLLILFYPSLIIAITYTAVQELANFIGRASSINSRMRSFI